MTREKLSGAVVQKGRSKALAIADIGSELGEITDSLNKRLQEAYLDLSSGRDHRRTHRGSSHRTSFIEYVSEVYNARKEVRVGRIIVCIARLQSKCHCQVSSGGGGGGMAGAVMDALSVRGQSISSGGSGESKVSSNLARDLSVRSEYVAPSAAAAAHAARIMTARSNTTRNKSKGGRGNASFMTLLRIQM